MHLIPVTICIYLLMLPVTGMVPVLNELTLGRHPHLTDFDKHLFMSANMAGALLFAPIAGIVSDALGRRRVIIVAALLVNTLALWMLTREWSYPVYLGWRFVEGCAHITALSLLMALGADHARRGGEGGAMGLVGAAVSLGVATGAPLGGVVGHGDALRVPGYGSALMLALALFALAALRDGPATGSRPGLGHLLRSLLAGRRLLVPYTFAFIDRLTVGFIVSTLSLYLATAQGLSAREIGAVMAAFLIPFALLTYPSGLLSRRWNRLGMMILGSLLYGVVLTAVGFAPGKTIVWLMLCGGVVAALMYAPSLVLTAELAGPQQKASAMSGFNLAGSLGFVAGPLAGGSLVTLLGSEGAPAYSAAFLVVGGLEVLCALAFLPLLGRYRA